MSEVKQLAEEARRMEATHAKLAKGFVPGSDVWVLHGESRDRFARFADALEASVAERDSLTATVERVRAVVQDALANADDSGNGWDAEVSAEALHEILDSAPPVARPLPDQEVRGHALFEAIADRLGEHDKAGSYEIADSGEYETKLSGVIDVENLAEFLVPAVLAAIEKGGESVPERGYHLSDCAVHNEPAMPVGPCNCEGREATHAFDRMFPEVMGALDGLTIRPEGATSD